VYPDHYPNVVRVYSSYFVRFFNIEVSDAMASPPTDVLLRNRPTDELKKPELEELCTRYGIKKTGNKDELRARLLQRGIKFENDIPSHAAPETRDKKKKRAIYSQVIVS